MKITALRLREFRKFTQPMAIEGLADGLNLLYGPNEAGKSTLAHAIRTLFFERHGTSGEAFARAIAPHGLQGASPQVEIDFELGGQSAQASKTFLQRPRASLRIGSQQWDSAEAEDMLASRLGFSFSGRGASRADKHGIPGLLWVEQGSSAELDAPVEYASDALQAQLKGVLGEMGGGQASRILQAIGEQLPKLRTATGRDSGELLQASKDQVQASALLSQLTERAQKLRSQTDALAHLLAQQHQFEQEKPWEAAEAKKQQAQQQLAALQPRQQSLQAQQERHAELERRIAALHAQKESREKELQDLAKLQAQQSQAQALQQQASDALQTAQAQDAQTQQQHADALALQRAASARQSRDELSAQVQRCEADIADITQRLTREQQRNAERNALHRELGAIQIDKTALKALEKLERQWQDARLQREAVATRIALRLLPGKTITAGALGALQGGSEHLITEPLTLQIAGVGEIDITPGGAQDVLRLTQTEGKLGQQLAGALQRLGVDSVASAQQRQADTHALQQKIELLQAESAAQLQERDPADWQRRLAELQGQQQTLAQQLAEQPAPPQDQNLPTPAAAQRLLDKAQKQWQEAQAQVDELRAQANKALLAAQTLASRIAADQERLQGSKAEQSALQQQRDLAEALVLRAALAQQIAEAEAAWLHTSRSSSKPTFSATSARWPPWPANAASATRASLLRAPSCKPWAAKALTKNVPRRASNSSAQSGAWQRCACAPTHSRSCSDACKKASKPRWSACTRRCASAWSITCSYSSPTPHPQQR